MYLKFNNKDQEITSNEFYDFIVETEKDDIVYTYILQRLGGYCCYGKLTNDYFKYDKVLKLDMNIYIPKIKYEDIGKSRYFSIPASGWYRGDEEFFMRMQHMHDVIETFYEIPHSLTIANHSDTRLFYSNMNIPYFQLHLQMENTYMYVIYFILDMYRRCFNLYYDLYWPIITKLEKEHIELNMVDLWILSDILNYTQPSDASLSCIYHRQTALIDRNTFTGKQQNDSNLNALIHNLSEGKNWKYSISSNEVDCVGKRFEITKQPELQHNCYDKLEINFRNLINQFIKAI